MRGVLMGAIMPAHGLQGGGRFREVPQGISSAAQPPGALPLGYLAAAPRVLHAAFAPPRPAAACRLAGRLQRRWHTGQKKVERCPCTMRRTGVPQDRQG